MQQYAEKEYVRQKIVLNDYPVANESLFWVKVIGNRSKDAVLLHLNALYKQHKHQERIS
jgi:hypothetical protein